MPRTPASLALALGLVLGPLAFVFMWPSPQGGGPVGDVVSGQRRDVLQQDAGAAPIVLESPGGEDRVVRSVVEDAAPEEAEAAAPAILGRVVDLDGQGLPGVAVLMLQSAEPVSKWLVEGGGKLATSDEAGGFRLDRLAGMRALRVELRAEGFIPWALAKRDLPVDGDIDLGTIELATGIHVHGRVIDDEGTPLEGVTVTAHKWYSKLGSEGAPTSTSGLTRVAGDFDLGWLAPGQYSLRAPDRIQVEDVNVSLSLAAPDCLVEIQVAKDSEEDWIEGEAVDARGRLLSGVRIRSMGSDHVWRVDESDEAGRFRIPRARSTTEAVELSAIAEGFDLMTLPDPVPWGTHGVRLLLPDAPTLNLRVTAATTGQGIEDFGVRYVRGWAHTLAPVALGQPVPLISMGRHADGVLRLDGILSGESAFRVEPPSDSGFFPSAYFERVVGQGDDVPLEVELARRVERDVRVVDEQGGAIVGCRVALRQALGPGEGPEVWTVDARDWSLPASANRRLLLSEGITDEAGHCVLSGPEGTRVAIEVEGPGCQPKSFDFERLEGDTPLVCTVTRSEQIEVDVVGSQALAEIEAAFEVPPTLRLIQDVGQPLSQAPSCPKTKLRLGRLAFSVEAGRWVPVLSVGGTDFKQPSVLVAKGEVATVTLDLGAWRPGHLKGHLVEGGKAQGGVEFELERFGRIIGGTAPNWWGVELTTDAGGGFKYDGLPGRYRLTVPGRSLGGMPIVASPGEFELSPGADMEKTFVLMTGSLQIRFLDGSGQAVPGVEGVRLVRASDGGLVAKLAASDADGYAWAKSCEAVGVHLRGFPKSLETQQARVALAMAEGSLHALDDKVLELGEAVIVAGEESRIEVVLPPAYFDQECEE